MRIVTRSNSLGTFRKVITEACDTGTDDRGKAFFGQAFRPGVI